MYGGSERCKLSQVVKSYLSAKNWRATRDVSKGEENFAHYSLMFIITQLTFNSFGSSVVKCSPNENFRQFGAYSLTLQHWDIVLQTDGNLHYDTRINENGADRTLDSIETYGGQKMSISESGRYLPILGRPLPISSVREFLLLGKIPERYCL